MLKPFPNLSLSHCRGCVPAGLLEHGPSLPRPPAEPCPRRAVLTHAEDVEAEALRDRLADQLIRETVEAHMAPQGKVPLLFILAGRKRQISRAAGTETRGEAPRPRKRHCTDPNAAHSALCFISNPLTATNKRKERGEHCSYWGIASERKSHAARLQSKVNVSMSPSSMQLGEVNEGNAPTVFYCCCSPSSSPLILSPAAQNSARPTLPFP